MALTLFAACLAAGLDLTVHDQRWEFLILAMSIVLSLCVNLWMLQRRFKPLESLIRRSESIDPSQPATVGLGESDPIAEINRLACKTAPLLLLGPHREPAGAPALVLDAVEQPGERGRDCTTRSTRRSPRS